MRVVVTSNGEGLDAAASPVFGRCRSYVFIDTDTMEAETVENPAMNAAGGAGIQAAQFVVEQGAEAVITGNVGPNAYNVFRAAGVPAHLLEGGSVRDAVEAFKKDQLPRAGGATGPAHAGMGGGMGRGLGRRTSGGRQSVPSSSPAQARVASAAAGASTDAREEEITELADMAADLRKRLAEVMDRLDELEGEA